MAQSNSYIFMDVQDDDDDFLDEFNFRKQK